MPLCRKVYVYDGKLAFDFSFGFLLHRRPLFKLGILTVSLLVLTLATMQENAIEWQYGMKQIVEFVKIHPEYNQVYMTDIRSQPYIFFLYYLRTPLPEYLRSVVYNRSESRSYSIVSYFDKYYFGIGTPIESLPIKGVLYVVSPSQYDGLEYKTSFNVEKVIHYPKQTEAFYLVSAKQL